MPSQQGIRGRSGTCALQSVQPSEIELEYAWSPAPMEYSQHGMPAECYYGLALRDEAQSSVSKVLELAQPGDMGEVATDGLARAQLIGDQLSSARGDFAQAEQQYTAASAAAATSRTFYLQWSALRYLTEVAMNRADWPRARASAEQMVRLSEERKGRDSAERLQAMALLITTLRYSGQRQTLPSLLHDAEASIQRVREANSFEIPFYLITDLDFATAELAFDGGRYAECIHRADTAIGLLKQHDGYLTNRYNLLLTAGSCHLAMDNASAAQQRASEALAIARQRMASNHLALASPLRLSALAFLKEGDLPQARNSLSAAINERLLAAKARPVFDIGLALTAALVSRREGCQLRTQALGALASFGLAYGPKEARGNKLLQLLLADIATAQSSVDASCPRVPAHRAS
ncbi:MAG: hypothetical protein JNN30_12490 [Rhodanobacteraceae bacterium]|nr:hypothetical protein [Rhodanobacteraceae bacterium]